MLESMGAAQSSLWLTLEQVEGFDWKFHSAERQYICSLFKTNTNYNRHYSIGRWQCILASNIVANSDANQD